jgi:hypothetical protein
MQLCAIDSTEPVYMKQHGWFLTLFTTETAAPSVIRAAEAFDAHRASGTIFFHSPPTEAECCERDGIVYVSRVVPDIKLVQQAAESKFGEAPKTA